MADYDRLQDGTQTTELLLIKMLVILSTHMSGIFVQVCPIRFQLFCLFMEPTFSASYWSDWSKSIDISFF